MALRTRRATSRRWSRNLGVGLASICLAAIPQASAEDGLKTLRALRVDTPITLDGVLDEAAWQNAPVGTDFVQREPDTGEPASQRTEIRVVYTATTLYFGIFCYDDQPELLIHKEMQRDQALWRDDSLDILIDTFDDDRNAYVFETNPNGAQTDALITDEGRNFNLQWDAVWEVVARTNDEGWVAEVKIPFTTLRFDPNAESWGFNVRRYIRRRAEEAYWAPILLDGEFKRVSLYGRLTGITDIQQGWNLNVKPFVVGESTSAGPASPTGEDDEELDFGLDLKWGVARGLSLDLTVNTDFGETEVDDLQVNLTRFSLFFEEKREFFLENAGIFEFGPGATGGGTPLLKVFHSRRIGIAEGEEIPIEWGARLTGRVGKWNIGILDVQTDAVDATSTGQDQVPRDNWGALRVARNFGQRSSVGMVFTNRDNEGNTNQVFGADLDFKPTPKLGFDAYFAASDNSYEGAEEDWSAGAGATWNGSLWDWKAGWVRVGEDFDPQMGFLLRRAVNRFNSNVTWEPRPATSKLLNYHFMVDAQVYTDLDNEVETEEYTVDFFGLRTAAADELKFFVSQTAEFLDRGFHIPSTEVFIPAGDYRFDTVGMSLLTHSSRPVSVDASVEAGEFYDGDQISGSLTLRLRPSRFIRSETTWAVNDIDLPDGTFTANIIRERLAVALSPQLLSNLFVQYNDLEELLSMNLRFNWIYRPGADLFVVFNQSWHAPSVSDLTTRDRQFILKFTYLFQR